MEGFFSPNSSEDQRSNTDQSQIIGGDADVDHNQIIGGDTVKLLVGDIPPGFITPVCMESLELDSTEVWSVKIKYDACSLESDLLLLQCMATSVHFYSSLNQSKHEIPTACFSRTIFFGGNLNTGVQFQ